MLAMSESWWGVFMCCFPLNYARLCCCGQRRTQEQKTASLPAISKLVFSCCFCAPRSSGPSPWHLLPLVFFPLPVDTDASTNTCAYTYAGVYTYSFPLLWMCVFSDVFTSALALAVLGLASSAAVLSVRSLDPLWRSRRVLKVVCHRFWWVCCIC